MKKVEPIGYRNKVTGKIWTLEEQPGADNEPEVYEPLVLQSHVAGLAEENVLMLKLLTDVSNNHTEFFNASEDGMYASLPLDYVSTINMYVSRDVNAENPFPATDAAIAEIHALKSFRAAVFSVIGIHESQTIHVAMVNVDNAFRRANCLSRIEHILSVPSEPEEEDEGETGEESLLRWGENPEQYAQTFIAALQFVKALGVEEYAAEMESQGVSTPGSFAARLREGCGRFAQANRLIGH